MKGNTRMRMKLRQGCRGWQMLLPAVIIDRVSKIWALKVLAETGAVTVIPGLLSWAYVENRGMAFGMASGSGWILILLTLLIIAGLMIYLLRRPGENMWTRTGLWMVIGGGLGNLYDRIAYGFVVDFIRADFISFPVFNVADIFVCVGVGFVMMGILMDERRKKHG